MITVLCPSCNRPMGIEANEASTEWECPTCAAAFLVEKGSGGGLECVITEPGKRPAATQFSSKPVAASSAVPKDNDIADETYLYALESLLKGEKPRDIREKLTDAGHSAKQAETIVQAALRFKQDKEVQEQLTGAEGSNPAFRN